MILVIDNYDSFTYNLVQYLGITGKELMVKRNNKITLQEIEQIQPEKIVISPGPGHPREAGITPDIIRKFYKRFPILGVCLGHQAIAHAFNGKIISARELVHGKNSLIHHDNRKLFANVQNPLDAGRYHSLVVEKESLPDCLEITAQTGDEQIMGIRHKKYPVEGVQFHPESILTREGMKIIENFINL